MTVKHSLSPLGALLALLVASAAPAGAQILGFGGEGETSTAPAGSQELHYTETRKITLIDNTGAGVDGLDDLAETFEAAGWTTETLRGSSRDELIEAMKMTDVLYLLTHAGVRESDQQVGFKWEEGLFWTTEHQLTADEVRSALGEMTGPALTVVAGCKVTANDSMADALGAPIVGFDAEISLAVSSGYSHRLLEKVAGGMDYKQAYASTEVKVTRLRAMDAAARAIWVEPAAE